MKELAIFAMGVFAGLVLGGIALLPTLVRLTEERDALLEGREDLPDA